jgi:hypothetical protein
MSRILTGYTCPWLMLLQYLLLHLWPFGRPVQIQQGRVVRVMPAGHGVEVRSWWPKWLILLECAWHNRRFWRRRRR